MGYGSSFGIEIVAAAAIVAVAAALLVLTHRLGKLKEREAGVRAQSAELAREAARYARSLLEASLDPLVTISRDGKITDVNAATEAATGRSRQALIGSDFCDYFTEPEQAREGYERVFAEGAVRDYPLVMHSVAGGLMDVLYNATIYRDAQGEVEGVFAAARDVTAQKRAERELRRLNRAYKALSRCSGAVARATEEQSLLQEVCDIAVQIGGYRLVWVGYAQADPGKTVRPMAMAGEASAYVATARITWDESEFGRGPTGTALRTGGSCFVVDIAREPRYAPWRESALRFGLGSVMSTPLKEGEASFGTLNVYAAERDAFDQEERELAEELAANLSYGIVTLRTRHEVRKASLYARSLIEASLDPLVTIDREGKVTDVNEATMRVTGIGRDQLVGTEFSDYFTEPQKAQAGYRQVFAKGFVTDYPLTIRHRDGRLTDVLYNATVFNDESGTVLGVFAAARDVTARNRAQEEIRRLNAELEQRVAQRTAQLEAANKELEAFTYSVAHDLRAPLRHIDGFAHLLAEDSREQLDDSGLSHLDHIVKGTAQMGRLIDDLLNLSRVGRQEIHLEIVGLSRLVEEIVQSLRAEIGERRVEWKIAALPFVECDATLVRQVFQNLLSNAVKFTRPRAAAVIEIGQTQKDGESVLFVRDNGVGFNMKYADKLFGVFQRLHRQEDFEGTGVGLVTVQRIIQKHGGRVWGEAELDRGATFYFTLQAPVGEGEAPAEAEGELVSQRKGERR